MHILKSLTGKKNSVLNHSIGTSEGTNTEDIYKVLDFSNNPSEKIEVTVTNFHKVLIDMPQVLIDFTLREACPFLCLEYFGTRKKC